MNPLRLLRSVVLLSVVSLLLSASPVHAQDHDIEERFNPSHALEFIQNLAKTADCTPLCGNPVCCIAFQQKIVTHVGDFSLEEFDQRLQGVGYSREKFLHAAQADENLYSQVDLEPCVDPGETSQKVDQLIEAAAELDMEMKCYPCCYPCGTLTCCGVCCGN